MARLGLVTNRIRKPTTDEAHDAPSRAMLMGRPCEPSRGAAPAGRRRRAVLRDPARAPARWSASRAFTPARTAPSRSPAWILGRITSLRTREAMASGTLPSSPYPTSIRALRSRGEQEEDQAVVQALSPHLPALECLDGPVLEWRVARGVADPDEDLVPGGPLEVLENPVRRLEGLGAHEPRRVRGPPGGRRRNRYLGRRALRPAAGARARGRARTRFMEAR